MTKSQLWMTGSVLLFALGLPVSSGAQSTTSNAPIHYGADGGEYTPNGFSLRGRAELTQGGNRFRADAIVGTSANGDLTRVEATGNVYFVTPTQSMRGDRAVYNVSAGQVVVTGDVILTQGKNVLSGNRVVYDVASQSARMEGGNGRIQGVFYPQGN